MLKTQFILLSVLTWTANLQAVLISNVSTINYTTPAVVAENRLEAGQMIYVDRTYQFASVPLELDGLTYIQTPISANGDLDVEKTFKIKHRQAFTCLDTITKTPYLVISDDNIFTTLCTI